MSLTNGHGLSPPRKRDVTKVTLPGTALYEGSHIDREEFIRLVIQSLRDVGYTESADVLEAESGYRLESRSVSAFRQAIIQGHWDEAEEAMDRLGAADEDDRQSAKYMISQQKYLELLEAQELNSALTVLRTELAPLSMEPERLQLLSSLLMSTSGEEVRRAAHWDGARGLSRQYLLQDLQCFIPSSIMIPPQRFDTLLQQAREYQRNSCLYHNSNAPFSLYTDHACGRDLFPNTTTVILAEHDDEVWDIQWSHDGGHLATASADGTAIVWRLGPVDPSTGRECTPIQVLRNHPCPVNGLSWSPDNETLLTCADQVIKVWKAKTGVCIKELTGHSDTITAVEWLPDGSGFISAGMDCRIVFWDAQGKKRDTWENLSIRITDIAMDRSRLIAVGISREPVTVDPASLLDSQDRNGRSVPSPTEGQVESTLEDYGEVTSVKISSDSRYALVGHGPNEIQLWDLEDSPHLSRTYIGHRAGKNVIRSCFGGAGQHFVASGSENGKVYIWQRETGILIQTLTGHGSGTVNCVAWNPQHPSMFASCSDDKTIRIWEPQPNGLSLEDTSSKGKQRWDMDSDAMG
ncbi:hypothetical protein M422DRAFT_61256 [Sphaerobolus stellatus SS14]|uniref:CTLH domain-containing protein n=1 Tax=Sphaerobolus stellatus (strain SS14) TaxID=990650 RepID=A0A0C9ULJ8_SPHS4|nr:hypothetical protein M422DRAFT_61256 [Sphaerobolus stellatus SS14]